MPLKIAVQMDHVSTISIAGDTSFRAVAGGAAARPPALPLHARPAVAARQQGVRAHRGDAAARREGQSLHARRAGAHRSVGDGRDPAAPGSALRHELHHHHAHPRAHPSEDAGGQRSGLGAQQPGKDLRHRIRRPDAGDADHQGSARRSPPSARSSATSSSSRSTAMAAPASSICTRPTAISPRCSKCSARCSASPIIVQRYLKDVRKGDKRIILIDGEPVGAINRVPAEHDSRSNMHVGGRAEKTELTDARARDLRAHRPVAEGARLHPGRHRRDRRLHDRDQRDLADRHSRGQALRRRRHRRAVLGCGRGQARGQADSAAARSPFSQPSVAFGTACSCNVLAFVRETVVVSSRFIDLIPQALRCGPEGAAWSRGCIRLRSRASRPCRSTSR